MAVCCGPTSNDISAVMEPATLGSLYSLLHHDGDHKLTHYEKCCIVRDVLDGKGTSNTCRAIPMILTVLTCYDKIL